MRMFRRGALPQGLCDMLQLRRFVNYVPPAGLDRDAAQRVLTDTWNRIAASIDAAPVSGVAEAAPEGGIAADVPCFLDVSSLNFPPRAGSSARGGFFRRARP